MVTSSRTHTTQHSKGRSSAFKAKCDANQHLVDVIADKREKISQSSKFSFTLRKALDSLCKSKEAITSFDDALKLNGIGPSIASMLFKKDIPKKKTAGGGRKKTKENNNAEECSHPSSNDDSRTSPSLKQSGTSSSKVPTSSAKPSQKHLLQTLLKAKEQPSRKEAAYQKARKEAENWKGKHLVWKLVLLVDRRERKAEHYSSKVQQCGIPTEIRQLPIGDMTWIAQGCSPDSSDVQAELLLGTIIERKEVSDLKSSLFGTRYNEQQLRLKESGQPQVIFLIEGDIKKDLYRCPSDTLHSVLWNIRIDKGNQVIQTAHMEDTVNTLRRMHRRMLKRTFPTAFFAEALPSFAGPEAGSRGPRRRDSFGEPQQGRKRRRRLDSLHGLVFDEEPVPMAGMDRFMTYKELCAKVERDRESGRCTVGGIYQAMLKQVATISDTKIPAICKVHPTLASLLKAFDDAGTGDSGRTLLQFIALSGTDDKRTAGKRTLGARSAAELFVAYGLSGEGYNSEEEPSPQSAKPNYSELVQNAISKQEQQLVALQQIDEEDDDSALRIAVERSLAEHDSGFQTKRTANTTADNNVTERKQKRTKIGEINKPKAVGAQLCPGIDEESSDDDDILLAGSALSKRKAQSKQNEVIELD